MVILLRKIIMFRQIGGLAMKMPTVSLIEWQKKFGTERACAKAEPVLDN
jgi:uncharacterized membrane protein